MLGDVRYQLRTRSSLNRSPPSGVPFLARCSRGLASLAFSERRDGRGGACWRHSRLFLPICNTHSRIGMRRSCNLERSLFFRLKACRISFMRANTPPMYGRPISQRRSESAVSFTRSGSAETISPDGSETLKALEGARRRRTGAPHVCDDGAPRSGVCFCGGRRLYSTDRSWFFPLWIS